MATRRGFLGVLAAAFGARDAAATQIVRTANGTHELWRMVDDPLRAFLEECCVTSPGSFVPALDMAIAYSLWRVQAGERAPLVYGEFSRRMQRSFRLVRTRFDGRQCRVFEGVALKRGVQIHA